MPRSNIPAFSILGITNAGKTTLMEYIEQNCPTFGTIQIGKEMRKRHPPEYFGGLAAMPHTEKEVWEIFDDQLKAAEDSGKRCVVIDGQPRLASQVTEVEERLWNIRYIQIVAPHEVLMERAQKRAKDAANLELSMKRLVNDYQQLYYVIAEIMLRGQRCIVVDSTDPDWIEATARHIEYVSTVLNTCTTTAKQRKALQ
jgi:hypothetical protein